MSTGSRLLAALLPLFVPVTHLLAADGLFVLRGYSDQQLVRFEAAGGAPVILPLAFDLANRVRVLGDRLVVVDSGSAELLALPLDQALAWQPGDPAPAVSHLPVSSQTGANPWDVIQLQDGRLAVSNLGSGTVALLAADTLQHEVSWPGASPQGLARQGSRLLVTDSGFGSGTRLLTLDLGSLQTGEVPTLENPQDLLVLENRVDVLCSGNWFTGQAFVHGLDPVSLAPVDSLRLGAHAGNLVVHPDGSVFSGDPWAWPQPGTFRYHGPSRQVSHDADSVFGPGGAYPALAGDELYTGGSAEIYRMDLAGTVLDTLAIGGDLAHFCLFERRRTPELEISVAGGALQFAWTPGNWPRWILWQQPFGPGPATVLALCDTPGFVLPLAQAGPMARYFVTGTDQPAPAALR